MGDGGGLGLGLGLGGGEALEVGDGLGDGDRVGDAVGVGVGLGVGWTKPIVGAGKSTAGIRRVAYVMKSCQIGAASTPPKPGP